MRILLVDDFSGVHLNLLKMLFDAGHEARLLTSGDGYKAMNYHELNLPVTNLSKNSVKYFFSVLRYIRKVKIIQLINLYRPNIYVNFFLILCLKLMRKEIRYYAVGTDPAFLKGGEFMRHFAWDNFFPPKYSFLSTRLFWCISRTVTLYVPNKSYALGFELSGVDVKKLFYPRFPRQLSLQAELQKIVPSIVYAPVSRRGFKGYNYIESACETLIREYPTDILRVHTTSRIPFIDYVSKIRECHILIDQCLSSDYAMNAILGLECGKIVLCGVSSDHLDWAGIAPEECPIRDILPDANNIVAACKLALDSVQSDNSYDDYLEKFHGSTLVLKQFFT